MAVPVTSPGVTPGGMKRVSPSCAGLLETVGEAVACAEHTGYPVILDTPYVANKPRQTRVVDLVGNYVLSGGDFLNVELQDETVVARRYLAIFDWRTWYPTPEGSRSASSTVRMRSFW